MKHLFRPFTVLVMGLASVAHAQGDRRSYLDVPRIHIGGRFFANPSTINNDPRAYDPKITEPAPWQDPMGLHYFRLRDCTVRSVIDASGVSQPNDLLVGQPAIGTDNPGIAKMVDLDVYQQGVSTIFGFELQVTIPDAPPFVARMDPPSLNSINFARVLPERGWTLQYGWGSDGGDANVSGFFQTVLRVPVASWPRAGQSGVLDDLRAKSDVEDGNVLLSFRFILDGYSRLPGMPGRNLGRFSGVIGAGSASMPSQTPGERWLVPRANPDDQQWFQPRFAGAAFKVDQRRKTLIIDLGNSICLDRPSGPPVNLGELRAVAIQDDGSYLDLGQVDYSEFLYQNTSGIAEVHLSDEALAVLVDHPLALVASREDIGDPIVLRESDDGLAYAFDDRVFRMTPEPGSEGSTMSTRVCVTKWGKPAKGIEFALEVIPVEGTTRGNTGTPGSLGDTSQAKGKLGATVLPSDQSGYAHVEFSALGDPGMRTPQLDGQVYFIYAAPTTAGADTAQTQERQASVLLFSAYTPVKEPSFEQIAELFWPYVKLYPGMGETMNLSDHHSLAIFGEHPPWVAFGESKDYSVDGVNRGAVPYLLTRDIKDPRFMPVTRDLSPNRVKTILNWFKHRQRDHTEDFAAAQEQLNKELAGTVPPPETPDETMANVLEKDVMPYAIAVEAVDWPAKSAPPGMHSFVHAVLDDGRWLLIGGRLNGLHTFWPQPVDIDPNKGNFPPKFANPMMVVMHPEQGVLGTFDVRNLAPNLAAQLLSTNMSGHYDRSSDEFCLCGGYGVKDESSITFPTLLRMPATGIADLIMSSLDEKTKTEKISAAIERIDDPMFAITGGALLKMDGVYYLVFGQLFDGEYSAFSTLEEKERTIVSRRPYAQLYSQAIRTFTINPLRFEILSSGETRNADLKASVTEAASLAPFHRRDGNFIAGIDPATGRPNLIVLGGVFVPGEMAAYMTPITITGPGEYSMHSFQQTMSQYQCPVVGIHDPSSGAVWYTLFGGISHSWYHHTPKQQMNYNSGVRGGFSDGLPFVTDISAVVHRKDGTFADFILPDPYPDFRLCGTSTGFALNPDLKVGSSGVFQLDDLQPGGSAILGYIFGGIEANNPLTLHPGKNGAATRQLFRVTVTRTPSPAIPAAANAKTAAATPGFRGEQ